MFKNLKIGNKNSYKFLINKDEILNDNETLGVYLDNQLLILLKKNVDKIDNIEDFLTLLHEYIHLLQNISTCSGLTLFLWNSIKALTLNNFLLYDNPDKSSIKIPILLNYTDSERIKLFFRYQTLHIFYSNYPYEKDFLEDDSYYLKTNDKTHEIIKKDCNIDFSLIFSNDKGNVTQNNSFKSYASRFEIYKGKIFYKEIFIHFTPSVIMESMAFLVEKFYFNKYQKKINNSSEIREELLNAPIFPYKILELYFTTTSLRDKLSHQIIICN